MTLARGPPLQKLLIHICDKENCGREENFKAILPPLTIKLASVILIMQILISSKPGLSPTLSYAKKNQEQIACIFSCCLWSPGNFAEKEHRYLLAPDMALPQQTLLLSAPEPSTHLSRPGSAAPTHVPDLNIWRKSLPVPNQTLFSGLNPFSTMYIMELTFEMGHSLKVCNTFF